MIKFLKNHTLISIYSIVFFGLLYGVHVTSGTKYFPQLFLFFGALIAFYILFSLREIKSFFSRISERIVIRKVDTFLLVKIIAFAVIGFILMHLVYLGGSPAIKGMNLASIKEVASLRLSITDGVPAIIKYPSSIILKGVLPFLIFYFLIKDKKIFYWVILLLGCFYAFSMMQKSYVVGLLVPSLIYSIIQKKWLFSVKYVFLMGIVVFGLSFIANPQMKVENKIVEETDDVSLTDSLLTANEDELVDDVPPTSGGKFMKLYRGLKNRLLIVPGQIVSGWFEHIPKDKPFLYGDGYRIVANIQGKEHRAYASELYPIIKPQFARKGYKGTVNVASFMYDYANFGNWGLVLAGFLLALVFVVLEVFYSGDFRLKLSLNLYPLLFLSSSALTTLMFSGGWGFLILFYFLFLKRQG